MNKKMICFIWGILLFILFVIQLSFAQTTALKAGILINPETGVVEKNVTILIEGKRIKSVGKEVEIPEGSKVIDLTEMTVIPGLFDCHTHVCDLIKDKGNLGMSQRTHYLYNTTVDRALQGVANAKEYLLSGFTTIRDVGNAGNYADVSLKKAINKGLFPGPNMLVSGKIIAPFGGQYHMNFEKLEYPLVDHIYADTKDEIIKGIRQNLHLGADWIKIVIDDQRYYYTPEDVELIVKEAANAGVKVAAHCIQERGILNAINGGVESLEHAFVMSDNTLELAKSKDIWLVGTDFSKDILNVFGMPQIYDLITGRLKRAHKIGVKMAFGSDVFVELPGYTRGKAVLTLIDTWVDAEIPALDILRAFTINSAKLLGIDKQRGLIKQGMTADIIAVPDNPLENIKTLKDVKFVMKEGKIYKRGE